MSRYRVRAALEGDGFLASGLADDAGLVNGGHRSVDSADGGGAERQTAVLLVCIDRCCGRQGQQTRLFQ